MRNDARVVRASCHEGTNYRNVTHWTIAPKILMPSDYETVQRKPRLTGRLSAPPKGWKRRAPHWASSLLVHVLAITLLAWVTFAPPQPPETELKFAHSPEQVELEEALLEVDFEMQTESLEEFETVEEVTETNVELSMDDLADSESMTLDSFVESIDFGDFGELETSYVSKGMTRSNLSGRGGATKKELLRRGGGTPRSEKAVAAGLDWLARHQYPDGSWNFDHTPGECNGRCENPGIMAEARPAATGLALMAFFGAGHMHGNSGKYSENIERGLEALIEMGQMTPQGMSFYHRGRGAMYTHGIASTALCEAYAMTGDARLREPAQGALDYICYFQDPTGGGWRYDLQQKGDTSVTGWQIAALKSGHLGQLSVKPEVITKASSFIDSMKDQQGVGYGYTIDPVRPHEANQAPTTTAIGVLCQMFMGVEHADPHLKGATKYISSFGPSVENSYHNYYATQVLFHYTGGSGPMWFRWNEKMRKQLVESQNQKGHATGSWTPGPSPRDNDRLTGAHGSEPGGRLYTTTLSIMTLEVYYRMMPLYDTQATRKMKR